MSNSTSDLLKNADWHRAMYYSRLLIFAVFVYTACLAVYYVS